MTLPKRLLSTLLPALLAVVTPRLAAQDLSAAPQGPQALCDSLIVAMKKGDSMTYAARRDYLAPEVRKDVDLAFMTRLVVGPGWAQLSADDKAKLVDAFSDYSIATYAQRFKSYSGQRFEIDPTPAPEAHGNCLVHTKLYTGDPQPVELDYLMRSTNGHWQVIDVYLNGTISEMAARRSEYSTLLREGGAQALVDLLKKKTAEFAGQ